MSNCGLVITITIELDWPWSWLSNWQFRSASPSSMTQWGIDPLGPGTPRPSWGDDLRFPLGFPLASYSRCQYVRGWLLYKFAYSMFVNLKNTITSGLMPKLRWLIIITPGNGRPRKFRNVTEYSKMTKQQFCCFDVGTMDYEGDIYFFLGGVTLS